MAKLINKNRATSNVNWNTATVCNKNQNIKQQRFNFG